MKVQDPTPIGINDPEIGFPADVSVSRLNRKIGPAALIIFISIIVLAGSILFFGITAYRGIGRLNDEQDQRLARLEEQASRANRQVANLEGSNREINAHLSLTAMLWNAYSKGVCLISGTYIYVDPATSRPLRLAEEEKDSAGRSIPADEGKPRFTTEGNGRIAEVDFEGTGFYVGGGYILTNRHIVVEPWKSDVWSKIFGDIVNGRPRMKRLSAYFPGRRPSYPLKFKLASSQDDIAVCTLNVTDLPSDIPLLPLDHDAGAVTIGQSVVMMGYPAGADRLLSLLPEKEIRRLQERYGESGPPLIDQLSKRGLVKPLASRGEVMDSRDNQIVYDATSGEGESGAPVFGPAGRVVGIHYGYFMQNRVSSSAAPIKLGVELLIRAGWNTVE
jgi:S1-C subfamily serine protease